MVMLNKLKFDIAKIPDIIKEFESFLSEAKDNINLKGKTIEEANKEQASLVLFYFDKKAEVKILLEYIELKVNETKSKLYKNLIKGENLALNDREREKFLMGDDKFIKINYIYLEIKELYEKFGAVCDAFSARGYALNNIVKLRVANIEDGIL